MDPNITDVLADAAIHLGDTNAEQFTPTILTPFFGQSFREAFDLMVRWKLPMGMRTAFAALPAFTNQLLPSQAGIFDLGEPNFLWERQTSATATVTNVTNATPVVVTVSDATGITSNSLVDITGVVGPTGVNGEWYVTVSGNNLTLNGSVASGVYSSGGSVIVSSTTFGEMVPIDDFDQTATPAGLNGFWKWEQERFWFIGATAATELRIRYSSSGNPPTSGTVGIDNFRNFGAFRTAGLAAFAYDMDNRAQFLNAQALGPSMQPDGTGGALRGLLLPKLLEKQKRPALPGPFRPRRNIVGRWFW